MAEPNLLLEWPSQRSRPEWAAIFGFSVALHLVLFFVAVRLPELVHPGPRERTVVQHRIPLYLPPDLLTQKAPNKQKPSKQIELADLLASRSAPPQATAPQPSRKRFELPKQPIIQEIKKTPQILPEAPNVALNQTPAPPPPAPVPTPFQNIGTETPPDPHPKLAPPKATVEGAINALVQSGASRKIAISDDNQSEPTPSGAGSLAQAAAQHAAVELQSDPQGADFRPYLTQILSIVRTNWRRVIPLSARMGTLRGRTVVEFIINRDGSIPKLVTADPSGSEPLDRAAVAGLSMSNPLPPLPADYKGMQVRLAFSFAYNMPAQ